MAAISFGEHYSGHYGRYVHERRLAGTQAIAMFEMLQPAGDFSDPPVSDLVIIETASCLRGDWNFGAGRIRSAEAGLIFVVPPNCPTDIVIDMPHLFRAYAAPTARIALQTEEICGGRPPDFARLQHRGTRNPLIAGLLQRLWAAGANGGDHGCLFADSAFITLFAELVREAGQAVKAMRGGLTPRQIRRVEAYVEEMLGRDISLAELAQAADLSPFHFARSFKQEVGMTPFRFLLKRRVARAQTMLQDSDAPLSDIALACGFAGQSSFTTAFRRETGFTPGQWRRRVARHN